MQIQTITMAQKEAKERFLEYRRAVLATPNPTDEALMRGYKALAKGRTVLDLAEVMKAAGLDDKWRPRLAIVRADAKTCVLDHRPDGVCHFWADQNGHWRQTRRYVALPPHTFTWPMDFWKLPDASAIVPLIPPRFRPRHALSNYHILWEAEWQDVPRDPILLRRLGGMLFAVLAQWDLTDLERSVLRGR